MFSGRFNDHRRCSCMIANELDGMGNISAAQVSAAQVSRKLKQLGLVLRKPKRSDTNFHLRDEGSNDLSSKSAGESDDETLLSLPNRKKKKISRESEQEELMADTTKKNADENNFQFRDIQVSERDEVDATNINYSSNSESETMRLDSPNASEIKTFENPDTSQVPLFDDQLVDELVDFDEDTDSIGKPEDKHNVVRRRARMVIDFEDDD